MQLLGEAEALLLWKCTWLAAKLRMRGGGGKRGRVGGGGPLRGPEGVGVEEGLRGGKRRRVS